MRRGHDAKFARIFVRAAYPLPQVAVGKRFIRIDLIIGMVESPVSPDCMGARRGSFTQELVILRYRDVLENY